MQTPDWQEKRLQRLRIDNFKCCRCGTPHNIQVHHLSYENLGNEDVHNDLITLCDGCHESIEKEVRAGCAYTKPFNYGSNYGIAKSVPLPADCAIIFSDMKDVDVTRQIQFKGGKIRLCRVHLAPSDYFNNQALYNEESRIRSTHCIEPLAPYEEYQWENHKTWDIFIEIRNWFRYEGVNQVLLKGELQILQNGIVMLCGESCWWEAYRSPTKSEIKGMEKILDMCEKEYLSAINQATTVNKAEE